MAAKIEERFQVGMYKARRVVRTESNYCINQAELKGMKDAGFDEYELISLGENAENVCDTCDDLDGQRFRIADAVVGVNCPPMHPFCQCKVTTPQETLEDIQADIDMMLDGRSIDDIELELDRQIAEMNALPESDSTLNSAQESTNSAEENSLNMLTGEDNGGIINAITIDDISKEAIIHEVKHAETIYGRTYANYECINEELQYDAFKIPISGREDKKSIYDLAGDISKLAQKDGLECIAECGVLIERGEAIDDDLRKFHDLYTSGGG